MGDDTLNESTRPTILGLVLMTKLTRPVVQPAKQSKRNETYKNTPARSELFPTQLIQSKTVRASTRTAFQVDTECHLRLTIDVLILIAGPN
jgi:hypothetical protein